MRWWDWVSPQGEQEMIPFLRAYVGKGMQFRTPKRKWEDLWRLKRGFLNNRLGERNFGTFKGPKYQRGILHPIGMWHDAAGGGGTEPDLTNVTDSESQVSPQAVRQSLAYDSDGALRWWAGPGVGTSIVYATLTTQTDDANNHTGEWWPDQPETNEGLNWDIQYNTDVSTGSVTARHYFEDSASAARTISTWYLLDTVSNDHADATDNGALGVNRTNGTAKTPDIGSGNIIVDVDIRATGSGSAVATHTVSLTVVGT